MSNRQPVRMMMNATMKVLLTVLTASLPLVVTANIDDGLVERARNIHERSLTLDAHADIEIPGKPSMYVGPDGLSKVAPEKMRDGQLDAVVMRLPLVRNLETSKVLPMRGVLRRKSSGR